MFYVVNDRNDDLNKIDGQYQKIFGSSLFLDFGKDTAMVQHQNPLCLEMPEKITAQSLPNITTIQEACQLSTGAELDFSRVREIDSDGLSALAQFLLHYSLKVFPLISRSSTFYREFGEKRASSQSTQVTWEVLFAYDRFYNNKETFEDRAIRFAIHFGISPPSWE